jgi:anti-sigma factor RsiW
MHRSSEQVSEWIVGERSCEVYRHLEDCRECREEVAQLQDCLRAFRQSAHDWADAPVSVVVPDRPVSASVSWTWASLTAVVIGLAVFPLYLDVRETRREAESIRDALLLDQVQERLERTVPQSMEPLMQLMSEEGEGGQ